MYLLLLLLAVLCIPYIGISYIGHDRYLLEYIYLLDILIILTYIYTIYITSISPHDSSSQREQQSGPTTIA